MVMLCVSRSSWLTISAFHNVVVVVAAVERSVLLVPGVEVVLTASDLCRRWMTSIQELLNYQVNIQDPPHQAVHLLVQAFKPITGHFREM